MGDFPAQNLECFAVVEVQLQLSEPGGCACKSRRLVA